MFTGCAGDTGLIDPPPPSLSFTESPEDGDTLTTDAFTIKWRGSEGQNQFKYILIYQEEGIDDTVATNYEFSYNEFYSLRYLDEGKYQFHVYGRGNNADTEHISVTFYINSFNGPALRIFKSKNEFTTGTQNSVYVNIDDVEGITKADFILSVDTAYLKVNDIISTSFSSNSNISYRDTSIVYRDELTGNLSVTEGLKVEVTVLGSGLSGSGKLCELELTAVKPGETFLEFSSVYFENSGGIVQSSNSKNGLVIIKN